MKKVICLLLVTSGIALSANAHISFELSNRLALEKMTTQSVNGASKKAANENMVNLIVDFENNDLLEDAIASGLDVTYRLGTHVFINASLSDVERIDALPGVKRIDLSSRRYLLNNNSREVTHVDSVHNGVDLPNPYQGENVIVALYDGGLYPQHINFVDQEGQYRVKKLWCFPNYMGWENDANQGKNPPADKDVYVYSTPEELSNFVTDDEDESHGTHVLGTAAGAYKISDTRDYRGMAPASDLLVACGRFDDVSIIRGVDSIATYAAELGKPCVINLSLGSNEGPHDGTDQFTAMLNEIAGRPNITICVAAGNEGSDNISLVKELTEEDNMLRSFTVGSWGGSSVSSDFQVWSRDDSPFELYLDVISPGQNNSEPLFSYKLTEGDSNILVSNDLVDENYEGDMSLVNSFSTYFTRSKIVGNIGLEPSNNRYGAAISLELRAVSGNYYLAFRAVGSDGQKLFAYTPDSRYMTFSSKGINGYDRPDGNGSINTIACGHNTIAVGAYSSAGGGNSLAYFTSWSEMCDGRTLPHIAAPGVDVTSSMSLYYFRRHTSSSTDVAKVNGKQYFYYTISGTSMATPAMTGVAALWLSANPDLTSDEIRNIAMSTATLPKGNLNLAWGAGKLNAYQGLKAAIGENAIGNVTIDSRDNILIGRIGDRVYEISAPGENNLTVEIYDIQGSLVKRFVSTSEVAVDLSSLQRSVYVVKAYTDRSVKTFKLY